VDGSPPLRGIPGPLPGSQRRTTPIDAPPRAEPELGAPPERRITTPYAEQFAGEHVHEEPQVRAQLLTIHAMPPPPPLPPPPPMADELLPAFDTLMGLPPPLQPSDSGPRFVPPPLDDRENSGIIPLSSPIEQPSMRGRIELDEDEWTHPGRQLASESMQRRVDGLLRTIASGSGDVGELRQMGEPAMLRLAAQFPGPLEILRRDLRALPPPSAHGPLVRTAIRIGGEIVPHLVDLFDHPSPDVRFYASFVFQELRDPRAMRPLSELAFDTSGDVRVISMRVLETYSRAAGFLDAVRVVRAQLDSTNRTRQLYAARAVGTLRDIDAIAKLVDLLSSRDRFVQEAALESLCSITGQQLGLKPHRWKTWFSENEHRHRVEWIIESLRHRDLPVRRWAADELSRITNHRVAFSPMGDKKAREMAVEAWTDWWSSTGASRMLSGTE
ncbi:MAG: HEAT repeat domain-containing protein, partial [Deltaproteobacteria bacterium]|nr:HEAT repeat domain-containing protein [Nannocystaceae bacterium]